MALRWVEIILRTKLFNKIMLLLKVFFGGNIRLKVWRLYPEYLGFNTDFGVF